MMKQKPKKTGAKGSFHIAAFLSKTYEILDVLNNQYSKQNIALSEIVSWNEEGTAFIVKNVNEFSGKVLPMYFKHSNFASFVR